MKKYIIVGFALCALVAAYAEVPMSNIGVIRDIAGVPGKRGFSGDRGDALQAQLANPSGIAIDRYHNIYIADTNNHRIRRIHPRTGEIDTIAGNGRTDFYNDGGNADMAGLKSPTAMVIDDVHGFLFVADTGQDRIRSITLKGYPDMLLTGQDPFRRWALPQIAGPDDDATELDDIHIPRGYIYTVAGNGRRGYEGEDAKAIATSLYAPAGLAISPDGELYIADSGNNRIRKIDRNTGKLVTVVGTGDRGDDGDFGPAINARLNRPTVIKFDKHGNLFIVDTGNHKIRFVDHRSGNIYTVAGDGHKGYKGDNSGHSKDARFNEPTGLALDSRGHIYVSDTNNHRIRRINIDLQNRTSFVETVVGTGKRGYNGDDMNAVDVKLAYPGGMVITPRDVLYFVDVGNNVVRRVPGISLLRPPTSYNTYGQPIDEEVDSRSFFEVLFKPQMQGK